MDMKKKECGSKRVSEHNSLKLEIRFTNRKYGFIQIMKDLVTLSKRTNSNMHKREFLNNTHNSVLITKTF